MRFSSVSSITSTGAICGYAQDPPTGLPLPPDISSIRQVFSSAAQRFISTTQALTQAIKTRVCELNKLVNLCLAQKLAQTLKKPTDKLTGCLCEFHAFLAKLWQHAILRVLASFHTRFHASVYFFAQLWSVRQSADLLNYVAKSRQLNIRVVKKLKKRQTKFSNSTLSQKKKITYGKRLLASFCGHFKIRDCMQSVGLIRTNKQEP